MSEFVPPPNYDDVAGSSSTQERFREYFATLSSDQLEIQELFKTVAKRLEETAGIGDTHPLYDEWNRLRQVRTLQITSRSLVLMQAGAWRATETQINLPEVAA